MVQSRYAALCAVLLACAEPPPKKAPPPPSGPGLTFTWPRDGQLDVPTRAPVVLHFSDPLDATAAAGGCDAFCLEGPWGVVSGQVAVVSPDTLVFTASGGFAEGATYRVHARAPLLPAATNLGADPVVTFTTRRLRPVPGAATVVGFNDAALDAGTLPLLDVATLRLLLSEPVDPSSVSPATVKLLAADGGAVAASLCAGGAHVVLDPVDALEPGATYTLSLSGVRDLGGEPVAPFSLPLTPVRGRPPGAPLTQALALTPAWTGAATPSVLSGWPVNASQTTSPLIGAATLGLTAGGLQAELGDAAAFGGPIPMIVRRGQQLDLTPLAIRFGGVLESGYQTATLHFTVLDDAVGFLTRNPLRPATQLPDDRSPVFVDLTLDTVLTAEDAAGNALATQTLMGLRLLGLSSVDGDQLVVDQIGALDLGTLGINLAPTTLALRLRTGAAVTPATPPAPHLTAVDPPPGALQAPPDGPLELVFSGAVTADGASLALTENGVAVPVASRVDGSALIVTPSRRLVDGAAMTLRWAGLASPGGLAVAPLASDPLGGASQLSFTVAAPPPTTAPPMLASVTVGAPCAISGGTPFAGGVCAGGQVSDSSYAGFELAANRELRVSFTQPMRTSTFELGTSCGAGAVRVERLAASGACQAVVPGTLYPHDRGFRFVPAAALAPGTRYRLVLVAGPDGRCDAGEVCSRAGVPLNTDPLAGQGSAGGPDVVLNFGVTPPTPDSLQPLASAPLTDLNGNGDIDATETLADENRAAMEVVGTSGIVTSASLNGPDCLPSRSGNQPCAALRTDLPVSVGGIKDRCPIDGAGNPTATGGPCLEVHVFPNVILSTSLSMNTTAVGILPINNLSTHGLVMRVREPGGPSLGYILREPADAYPQFVIRQSIYLDAPDLSIAGGVVSHDLRSKVLDVVLKGPVTFLPDGRMHVALKNTADVPLAVNIRALGLGGTIDLRIPAGEMHLTLVGEPLR